MLPRRADGAAVLAALWLIAAADAAEYARPELLVEPNALARELAAGSDGLVVLHAGGEAAIPGAVAVDVTEWKDAFGDAPEPESAWSERIGAVGIGPESRVVVYDDGSVKNAARVWWILSYWGVSDVALLDGGLPAWREAGYDPVDADTLRAPEPAEFQATAQPSRVRTTGDMVGLADSGAARIIDTRSDAEVDSLGTIGADTLHCEWTTLIDRRTRRFLPADKLAERLDVEPAGEPRAVVAYCRSGGRASVAVFALELLGVDSAANYHGSWTAWRQRDGAGE